LDYEAERFFEMSVDLLCIASTDGYFKRVNQAFERTLGWTHDDLLARPFIDFVHPDDRTATATEVEHLAAGIPTLAFENRYRCRDGTYRRLLWTTTRESGSSLLYAVAHDVTEKSRKDAWARQLANAVEQTADTVIITDRSGRIEYVNPAFESTTGYCAEEAIGQTPRLLKSGLHPPEFYRALWARLLAGQVVREVLVNRTKSGTHYYAEQTITPMRDSRGTITSFVSVIKDITEFRKREEQDIELRLAASIQHRLYPAAPPVIPGFDVAARTAPSGAMNGDYFDYVTLRDGAVAIAIGDVCGHGLGQALLMAETRAYLRSLARVHDDVGVILTNLDLLIAPDLEPGRFVSMLLARLDPRTGSLRYANAGHEPGYLLDPGGAVKMELGSTGPPLGFPDEVNPLRLVTASSAIHMVHGDMLVLLTDGIAETESPDGTPFGPHGALGVIGGNAEANAQTIVDALTAAVLIFQDGSAQRDDVTMVVCKRHDDDGALPALSA
jgi:PAS domain S-box-containing protein